MAGTGPVARAVENVRPHDVDQVLRVDASRSVDDDAQPLPFSPQLEAARAVFVRRHR